MAHLGYGVAPRDYRVGQAPAAVDDWLMKQQEQLNTSWGRLGACDCRGIGEKRRSVFCFLV
jgi:hypothetical protein